jgi:serine/threonine-protein kinase
MGVVYEAVHTATERRVALKLIRPDLLDNPEVQERFRREARVAARIDSDFVVDVLDAGVDAKLGVPFLAMELLRGEDLGAKLDGTTGECQKFCG